MAKFQNPNNRYIEDVERAGLWCLLFGTLYFAVKGVWGHAVISLVLAILTVGISWLIYPFFAQQIVETNYLRRGWVRLNPHGWERADTDEPSWDIPAHLRFKPSSKPNPIFVIVLLVIAAGSISGIISTSSDSMPKTAPAVPASEVVTKASTFTSKSITSDTRNVAQDRLIALSPAQQATSLGLVVGEGCVGKEAFYSGLVNGGPNPGAAIWKVRCKNGKNYVVQINPDAQGTTRVLQR